MSALNLSIRPLVRCSRRLAYSTFISSRRFSRSPNAKNSSHDDATTGHPPKASGQHEGKSARTDPSKRFHYSEPETSEPVRGHGGRHFKPTLASFSLEGKVAVVTGGARGLGLVMAQGLMTGGAEIALVDLNSTFLNSEKYTSLKNWQENRRMCLPRRW
jgi:D-arabinitol 2-dehydrogenase